MADEIAPGAISIGQLLSTIPDDEKTADTDATKLDWLKRAHGLARRTSNETFLIAWNIGKVLDPIHVRHKHGRDKNFKEWCDENLTFSYWRAVRYVRLFRVIPVDHPDFDTLTYGQAKKIAQPVQTGQLTPVGPNSTGSNPTQASATPTGPKSPALPTPPDDDTLDATVNELERAAMNASDLATQYRDSNITTIDKMTLEKLVSDCLQSVRYAITAAKTIAGLGKMSDAVKLLSKVYDSFDEDASSVQRTFKGVSND